MNTKKATTHPTEWMSVALQTSRDTMYDLFRRLAGESVLWKDMPGMVSEGIWGCQGKSFFCHKYPKKWQKQPR